MLGKLLLLFIIVPLVELFLFLKIGSKIGLGNTFLIILLTGFIGAILTRRQGRDAFNKIRTALAQNQAPHLEILNGLGILIAGALLITPGFFTDIVGFLLLFRPSRLLVASVITNQLLKKLHVNIHHSPDPNAPHPNPHHSDHQRQPIPHKHDDDDDVIDI